MYPPPPTGPTSIEDEPPLLEDLEIDFDHILTTALAVLHPRTTPDNNVLAADLSGPFCVVVALGAILLLSGKFHFGYIYGLGLIGCVLIHLQLTLMADSVVPFIATVSVLGYCLIPIIVVAVISIIFNLATWWGGIIALTFIGWATWSAANMMAPLMGLDHAKALVAYPIFIFYSSFSLLAVF